MTFALELLLVLLSLNEFSSKFSKSTAAADARDAENVVLRKELSIQKLVSDDRFFLMENLHYCVTKSNLLFRRFAVHGGWKYFVYAIVNNEFYWVSCFAKFSVRRAL